MKDQNSVPDNEPQEVKFNRGLDLFTESVLKPDPELRPDTGQARHLGRHRWHPRD